MSVAKVVLGPIKGHLLRIASLDGPERVALLLGKRSDDNVVVYVVFRVDNVRGSPVEFEGDPWQLVVAHKAAEKYGLEVVGVFHTHPACPASPSPSDVDGMKKWPYPWVIACPGYLRAWLLEGGKVREVAVE